MRMWTAVSDLDYYESVDGPDGPPDEEDVVGVEMDCTEDDPCEFEAKWTAEDEADARVTERIEMLEDVTDRYIPRKPAMYETGWLFEEVA